MIAPHVLLRMRQNRWHAGIPAIASVYFASLADEYTDLVREAVGPSEVELLELAMAAGARGDWTLHDFALHVAAMGGHRRAA